MLQELPTPLTLHIVPHTHWDREWYLSFQEFRIRLVHLMDRLLEILNNDTAYRHFMLDGQSILLDDYLEIRPERAPEIEHLVRLGRLAIGPWYVLPDEFLVSPESLVRNLMLGHRICRRFGDKMLVGYVPDPFGHVGQLPQILQGFAIETAAFRRGLAEEPAELWWDAPDGSRVLVSYLRDGYDNAARLPTADPDAFVAAIRGARDSLAPHAPSRHLLLLAGTDHQEPQTELPDLIAYANDGRLDGDRLVHSSLPAYTAAVHRAIERSAAPGLCKVAGELRSPQCHHLLPGVLSARMWIKQRNDAVETLLTRWAEPFAAWAELVDVSRSTPDAREPGHLTGHEPLRRVRRPEALIWHAWRLLLQNHPHDSICGCSVDQVHREMTSRFDQAEQIAHEIIVQSLTAIAEQADTRIAASVGEGRGISQPLLVFNPSGGPRTDIVTARLRLPGAPDALEVVGPDGQIVPHQVSKDPIGMERALFELEATPQEVAASVGMVEGGRLLNHVVHRVELRQTGDQAEVRLLLGENGEPDHAHLAAARAQVESLIAAGGVSRFTVRGVIAETRDLTFVAPDLPGYGYATFVVRPSQGSEAVDHQQAPDVHPPDAGVLENDHLCIQVDTSDGTLTLTDKTSGAVYHGLNRFMDGGDRGDTYNYCQPEEDQVVSTPVVPPTIRVIEQGIVRQTLEIAQVYRVPRSLRPDRRARTEKAHGGLPPTVDLPIVSRVSLYTSVRRVDIETTVDNQALDHRLRVHFPLPVKVDHAHTGAHYYIARRPVPRLAQAGEDLDTSNWTEQPVPTVPQRGWAEVSDGQAGLLLANRGLPEVEFIPLGDHTTIALTLLRCVGWLSRGDLHCRRGHAGPGLPTPEAQCLGPHTFHYALISFAGHYQRQAREGAEAFRTPLRAVAAGFHAGALSPTASVVQVEPAAFAVTAIKHPEGRSSAQGLLVRGVNMSDQPIIVRLRPWRDFDRIARVNLNEDFVEPLLAEADGAVTLSACPWHIVTVRWEDV